MRTVVREDIFRVELKIACVAFEESALVDLREIEIELVLFDVSQKITTDFSRLSGLPAGKSPCAYVPLQIVRQYFALEGHYVSVWFYIASTE